MSSNFHVGQKVVCINDDFDREFPNEIFPVKGAVYTIRSINVDSNCPENGDPCFLLAEIVNNPMPYDIGGFAECDFGYEYFRPVRTTDISIFTAMLAPSPKQREAA